MKTNSKVLWQIGLAVAIGLGSGYLIALKFGLTIGLITGTLFTFIVADPKSVRENGPALAREFAKGWTDFFSIHRSPDRKIFLKNSPPAKLGRRMAVLLTGTCWIGSFVGAMYMNYKLLPIFTQKFPGGITNEKFQESLLIPEITSVFILTVLLGLVFLSICETEGSATNYSFVRKFTAGVLNCKEKARREWHLEWAVWRDGEGKIFSLPRLLALLFLFCGIAVLPVVSALGTLFLIGDTVLTVFFTLATSRNVAAGITTFAGILCEYLLYPTMSTSATDVLRFALFAVGGAIVGVALYRFREELIRLDAKKANALALLQ